MLDLQETNQIKSNFGQNNNANNSKNKEEGKKLEIKLSCLSPSPSSSMISESNEDTPRTIEAEGEKKNKYPTAMKFLQSHAIMSLMNNIVAKSNRRKSLIIDQSLGFSPKKRNESGQKEDPILDKKKSQFLMTGISSPTLSPENKMISRKSFQVITDQNLRSVRAG